MGEREYCVHKAQAEICCGRLKKGWSVSVTEKLDGCCVAVANVDGAIHAVGRGGYLAADSRHEHVRLFAHYVRRGDFAALPVNTRVVGEWLALAHGTEYRLEHGPFVVFAAFEGKGEGARLPLAQMRALAGALGLPTAHQVSDGPITTAEAMARLGPSGFHGAVGPPEGAVWIVERDDTFEFAAKYVRPDKVDGGLLPEFSGGAAIWNWRPGGGV